MGVADRATIANMAPEYGATMGFFPVDGVTLDYLRQTGRSAAQIELVESYTQRTRPIPHRRRPNADVHETFSLDLGTVEPSLAGPKRPQDRIALQDMKKAFNESLTAPIGKTGFGLAPDGPRTRRNGQGQRPQQPNHSRRRGHRGDHFLHQHQQPVGNDRSRPACQESGRARADRRLRM